MRGGRDSPWDTRNYRYHPRSDPIQSIVVQVRHLPDSVNTSAQRSSQRSLRMETFDVKSLRFLMNSDTVSFSEMSQWNNSDEWGERWGLTRLGADSTMFTNIAQALLFVFVCRYEDCVQSIVRSSERSHQQSSKNIELFPEEIDGNLPAFDEWDNDQWDLLL